MGMCIQAVTVTTSETLVRDLREAVSSGGLTVAYQPQFALDEGPPGGRPVAVEALCRWTHAPYGEIPPATFIPLAEDARLVEEIDIQVLERGAAQILDWSLSGRRIGLASNASPSHITMEYAEEVIARLEGTGLDPALVAIEITEAPSPQLLPEMRGALARLRSFGVAISIDDFGAGDTPIEMVESLPIDEVKIDRSLTQRADAAADAIVADVVSRARSQGWRVVAEGIETPDDLARSVRRGCHRGQGYLLGMPMSAEGIERLWDAPTLRG
jgi:EAL domain-containing protein (putative c-di-GMP-specific phosphodiesterase class I)